MVQIGRHAIVCKDIEIEGDVQIGIYVSEHGQLVRTDIMTPKAKDA